MKLDVIYILIYTSGMTTRRAKIFQNGRSQAVRLPREFRFEGKEVLIHRQGHRVILEPVEREWSDDFFDTLGAVSDDFERQQPTENQDREPLGE